jgi:hypothetical protein
LLRKALEVKLPDAWSRSAAVFDDGNLVSFAGLAPVLVLAVRAGLSELVAERVRFKTTKLVSAGVNPAGKLTGIIAGMATRADCIDDLEVIRSGGMRQVFAGVYAATIVRRVRDRVHGDELFPIWRHHPFFTNSSESTADADITHRQHAIIETLFADLIDGPLAHMPSGHFAANNAWTTCAAITHNLLRAAGTLASAHHAIARGATLRRHLVAVPARVARPQRRPVLHLPAHWPWANQWTTLWTALTGPPPTA